MCVVVWDRDDNIAEAGKQSNNEMFFKSVKFKDRLMAFSKVLGREPTKITEKQLKYFTTELKKSNNFGEICASKDP